MAQFKIAVDLSAVMRQARGILDASILPHLSQAVNVIAQQAAIDWREAVRRAKLWSGEKDAYANSIQARMTGAFSAEVWSDYKYAQDIETGRPPYDMKAMLNTSMKVRVVGKGKNAGKRYLIIPFTHQTPGADAIGQSMPDSVYAMARMMTKSRVTGTGKRASGTGAMDIKTRGPVMVAKRKYAWGGRLGGSDVPKMYQGMVRFNTSSGKAKSSKYMTFRVMMEGSPGWIMSAKPGQYLVKGVTGRLQPLAEQAFRLALKADGF